MAIYENLPGVFPSLQDGGLTPTVSSNSPKVMVLGTASDGFSEFPYIVTKPQEAANAFGVDGTLTRGMYEVRASGADNVLLYRIGATSCVLTGIGVAGLTGGITVETANKDSNVNTMYGIHFDNVGQRLVITNLDSDVVVYDCNSWSPNTPSIDRGEVYVSGAPDGTGTTIGTLSSPITLEAAGTGPYSLTYTAGTDGVNPSRMKLYELLFEAYRNLENVDFDIIVPMDVFLDDKNAADMTAAELAGLSYSGGSYPVTGSDSDALLYFYTEEYQGRNLFWWRRNGLVENEEYVFSFQDGYHTGDGDFVTFFDMAGNHYCVNAAIPNQGLVESSSAIDFSTLGSAAHWGTNNEDFTLDDEAGLGPYTITLDADCLSTVEVVTLINSKIAGIPAIAASLEAYRVDEFKIGLRRTAGGAGTTITVGAGVVDALAALNIAAGGYNGSAASVPAGAIFTSATATASFGAGLSDSSSASAVGTAFFGAANGLGIADVTFTDNGDGTVSMVYNVAGNPTDAATYDITEAGSGSISSGHVVKNEPDIYPAGYATQTPNGTVIAETNFHEVNFAYQLANFCFVNSTNNNECFGVIGVKPPDSPALSDVRVWVGKLPVYTTDVNGNVTINSAGDNGSGLLGNKFMAGKYGYRANVAGGGFIGTDTGFMDGTELEDLGGHKVDIGKYINVISAWVNIFNAYDTTGFGYITTAAPIYAGFISTLEAKSAPTNKLVPNVALPWRLSNNKLDQLSGVKYVTFQSKPKGIVVTDAPTAARNDSDYRRLTTVRIVKSVVDAVRIVADPFIGEAGNDAQRAALKTAIEGALAKLQKAGYVTRYDLAITATPQQRVAGEFYVELELVPAFETRRIYLRISLAAQ